MSAATVEKSLTETDFLSSLFVRYYSSFGAATTADRLGKNWSHAYEHNIVRWAAGDANVTTPLVRVYREGGVSWRFNETTPGTFVAASVIGAKLSLVSTGGYRVTTPEESAELYDATGRLLSITARTGVDSKPPHVKSQYTSHIVRCRQCRRWFWLGRHRTQPANMLTLHLRSLLHISHLDILF